MSKVQGEILEKFILALNELKGVNHETIEKIKRISFDEKKSKSDDFVKLFKEWASEKSK